METKTYREWLSIKEIDEEYGKFEKIESPRSKSPDLHCFLLLESLGVTEEGDDIICAAEHDEVYLNGDSDFEFTKDQAIELVRCGLLYSSEQDIYYMFA